MTVLLWEPPRPGIPPDSNDALSTCSGEAAVECLTELSKCRYGREGSDPGANSAFLAKWENSKESSALISEAAVVHVNPLHSTWTVQDTVDNSYPNSERQETDPVKYTPSRPFKRKESTLIDEPHVQQPPSKRTRPSISPSSSPDKKFVCGFRDCGKSFNKSSKLTRHEATHSDERPFPCPVDGCDKSYLRSEHLSRHALIHAPTPQLQRPFRCEHPGCDFGFTSNYHLNRHMKLHTTPTPYKCTFGGCTESFAKHSRLRHHMCAHMGTKPYPCDSCTKSFDTAQKLKQHQRVHSTLPLFQCVSCSLSYTKWTQLQAHIKESHKPTCFVCQKTFTRRDVLREHLKIHDAERDVLPCGWEGCDKAFANPKTLKVHVQASHENIKPFVCDFPDCDSAFAHKHLLVRHRRLHELPKKPRKRRSDAIAPPSLLEMLTGFNYAGPDTGRTIPCTVECCPYKFRRQYDLSRHLRSQHGDGCTDADVGKSGQCPAVLHECVADSDGSPRPSRPK
ncbi:hypothetical protein DFS34DRAFT_238845 [Phlyctochytrium arcticum]|nr:hypothetical protein DFS34DRAFT_238845 [Phlyctochytrium arcticum]